jgi:hypothetical protein
LRAASPVTVTLDTTSPGLQIPDDFAGFSLEIQRVLPDANGKHVFSPQNVALVDTFKQLGVKSLRIGGNTADRATVGIPNEADIDELFAFARAAGAKVIYTVRLRDYDPAKAAATVKYIATKYPDVLSSISVGNEPNVYAREYPKYKEMVGAFYDAISAAAPDVKFCGPSTTPGKAAWVRDYAKDFGPTGKVAFIGQHSYPGGNAEKVDSAEEGRKKLLSTDFVKGYQKFLDSFAPTLREQKLSFRLEEANSFHHGGLEGASDTFAATLWGLDYLHWWASHGAAGVNFHTGDEVAAGNANRVCRYASYLTSPGGYSVRPMGYAVKAFDVGRRGRIVPAKVESSDDVNFTAYGVLGANGALYVTLINKEHGDGARAARVSLSPSDQYARAETMWLVAPGNDITRADGITLGGATMKDDATWEGSWTSDPSAAREIELPPASAVIIKLTTRSQ